MLFYRIKLIGFAVLWLFTAINAWIYIFGPAVRAYGFWPFIGMCLVYTIIANIASFGFVFTTKPPPKPPTPMATYKETDHA